MATETVSTTAATTGQDKIQLAAETSVDFKAEEASLFTPVWD